MAEEASTRVVFDYLPSNLFRIVHVDGAFGGITPRGGLFVSLYSERPPIPTRMVHALTDDHQLGEEIREQRQVGDAIVREVEVGVMMDEAVARALNVWLAQKLAEIDQLKLSTRKPDGPAKRKKHGSS